MEQRLELDSLPQLLGQALMRSSSTPQGTCQPQHRGQMQDARGSWHGRQLGAPWQLVGPLPACMTLWAYHVCGDVPTLQLICMVSGPLAQGLLPAAFPGSIACCWQVCDGAGLCLCTVECLHSWLGLGSPVHKRGHVAVLMLEHCAVCALQDTASMQTLDGFGSSLGDVNNLSISSRPTSISLEMAHGSGLGSGLAAGMTANGGGACVRQQQQQQQQQQQVNHLLLQHSKLQNGGQFALDQGAFPWPAIDFGSSLIQPKALPASPVLGGCPLLQQAMLSDRNHTLLDNNSLDLLGDCDTKQGMAELPFLF